MTKLTDKSVGDVFATLTGAVTKNEVNPVDVNFSEIKAPPLDFSHALDIQVGTIAAAAREYIAPNLIRKDFKPEDAATFYASAA